MKPFLSKCASAMLLAVIAYPLAVAVPAWAQQSAAVATQDQVNQQLLQRLQDLEEEVKQLKAQQGVSVTVAPVPRLPAAEAPLPPAPAAVSEAPSEVNEVAPRLKLDFFGDVGAQGYNHNPDTFLFGSLDLFMTARLSEKFSTLGELLFLATNENVITIDVERLWLNYRQNKYFSISAGRYHTWVGYYNSHYNKAEYLETAADRPFIYAFPDDGGVLPMQDTGVHMSGAIPSGRLGVNYVFELGNGRAYGSGVTPQQNNQDANNSKAINGGLFMRPQKYRGLQLGFSLRHDNVSLPGPPAVGETIATAHAVFDNGKYEVLNEGVFVRHVEPSGPVFNTAAGYTQWSRQFGGKYRPYFRYQYFNAPSNDPVYVYASGERFCSRLFQRI